MEVGPPPQTRWMPSAGARFWPAVEGNGIAALWATYRDNVRPDGAGRPCQRAARRDYGL